MDPQRRNMYCLGCGYNLRALTERRCPECGREFDPDSQATWAHQPPDPPAKRIAKDAIGSLIAGCVAPVVVFLILVALVVVAGYLAYLIVLFLG